MAHTGTAGMIFSLPNVHLCFLTYNSVQGRVGVQGGWFTGVSALQHDFRELCPTDGLVYGILLKYMYSIVC